MSETPKVIWATYNDAMGFKCWEGGTITTDEQPEIGRYEKYHHDDTVTALQAKVARLEDTNCRLHRRTQEAEKDAYRKAGRVLRKTEDWKSMFYRWRKKSFEWQAKAEELQKAVSRKDEYISRLETLRGPQLSRKALEETR